MPHYKDGTPAAVGDIVRGKGYNIKDPATKELAEISGVLIGVTPNSDACNVRVFVPDATLEHLGGAQIHIPQEGDAAPIYKTAVLLSGTVEYGQADHFEKV